ncbi:hypothetical protein [Kribbella kalugense]|uniref:hypothetical protein n=1 Tax=Kribbella kalugense TaxID=2512221 RepID=UPI0010670157|nr:hypothetical protein [Kribbella kalugense]
MRRRTTWTRRTPYCGSIAVSVAEPRLQRRGARGTTALDCSPVASVGGELAARWRCRVQVHNVDAEDAVLRFRRGERC